MPSSGDLTSWARQGVLMLNASLTTTVGKAGAHMKIWDSYVKEVVSRIADYHYDNCNQLIFMLWGAFAQNFATNIDDDFHILMKWKHPSPLAQRGAAHLKFINCDHFIKANELLASDGVDEINWGSVGTPIQSTQTILDISDKHIIVFTDGSCYPNNSSPQSVGGYAALYTSGEMKGRYIYGSLDTKKYNATNIRAEGYAILRVLELVKPDTHNKLTIITDCQFWINMIYKYMPKWSLATFQEKQNPDLTIKIAKAYKRVKKFLDVEFHHVKSHNKSGWGDYQSGTYQRYCYDNNDRVDKLCTEARLKLQKGCEELH